LRIDNDPHTFESVGVATLELQPTLWRTCRVLANHVRLSMLQELFRKPDQTVTAMADRLDVPVSIASRYLRELNARGLLRAARSGACVSYRPAPNPSVRQATSLVVALRAALATPGRAALDEIFSQATALTHPRRVAIIAALHRQPFSWADLKRHLGVSANALDRHLGKLRRRGFIRIRKKRYELIPLKSPLAAALIQLAQEDA